MTQHIDTPRIDGHVIDLIRRTIVTITDERGSCPAATLAMKLNSTYPKRFRPDNWAGFPSLKSLLKFYEKYFEMFYTTGSTTDLMVRIPSPGASVSAKLQKSQSTGLSIPNIVRTYFTDARCSELVEVCNLSSDLKDPSRLRQIICYRMYRLEKEGKIIRDECLLCCHSGLYTNGDVDPLYILAIESQNHLEVKLIERSSPSGRELVRMMGNRELQPVSFPPAHYNISLEIVAEYSHVLDDHPERLPRCLLEMVTRHPDYPSSEAHVNAECTVASYRNYLLRQLMGAVELVATKLKNGTVVPVPFWFRVGDRMCWLVPLSLGIGEEPSVALVLDHSELNGVEVYRAHTVLTLEDAYRSARLIGRVGADWLSATAEVR